MQKRVYLISLLPFIIWGNFPIYFDLLDFANHWEILFQRIIWSFVFITLVITFIKNIKYSEIIKVLKKHYTALLLSSLVISINWAIFLYAVLHNRVLETSMGYFITPLINIFFALVIFKEKLSLYEKMALLLVFIAITIKATNENGIPWVALALAVTFGLYGTIHKANQINSEISLTIETWILAPIALLGLFVISLFIDLSFVNSTKNATLLISSGLITIIPLWLYIYIAKNIPMTHLAFITYLSPSLIFIGGIFYFNEPLSGYNLISFILIWIAITLVSLVNRLIFYRQKYDTH